MSGKKLYECRYEVVYYALAENAREAQLEINKVTDDDPFNFYEVDAQEFDASTTLLKKGWDRDSGIYGTGNTYITLGEAIDQILETNKVKDDRQMELPFMKEETNVKQEVTESVCLPI